MAGLTLSGNILYGTTSGMWIDGGSEGSVFKIDLSGAPAPIPLTAQRLGDALVLSWGNPAFALQAAPEPTGSYTNIPGASSPYTNAITEPQRFFRLVGH
jgi:hypothetical protein